MMNLNVDDITVTSFATSSSSSLSMAACTPTLDSLVDHLCPDGLTVGCRDETTEPMLAQ